MDVPKTGGLDRRTLQMDEENAKPGRDNRNRSLRPVNDSDHKAQTKRSSRDESVKRSDNPPLLIELQTKLIAKKKDLLHLIVQKAASAPFQFITKLIDAICDIDTSHADAGERLESLRSRLEATYHRSDDNQCKEVISALEPAIADLLTVHSEYRKKIQEWLRDSLGSN